MSRLRALLTAVLLSLAVFTAACSAEGNVGTGGDGDGVKVEGDVDAKND